MGDDERLRGAVQNFLWEFCGNITIPDLAEAMDALAEEVKAMSPTEPVLHRLYAAVHNRWYEPKIGRRK